MRLPSPKPILLWPLGAVVVSGLLVAFRPTKPPSPRPVAALLARGDGATAQIAPTASDAASCATCHPRQAAEWHRSVMAHAAKSPLFQALESAIEEQVGREATCPEGAGPLRKADPRTACRERTTGQAVTGTGGEHWCVNCHAPSENLANAMPAWNTGGRSVAPTKDLLDKRGLEGISCGFCHQVHGPVGPRTAYQGNATWRSPITGQTFRARPEDARGILGIGNSGYDLQPAELFASVRRGGADEPGMPHARPTPEARAHLRTSEFCGTCHDVRLFGTDVMGVQRSGEHFKRLRNAYSEWVDYAKGERAAGRAAASCQDCHMSTFPGVCEPAPGARGEGSCPDGTRLSPRAPGSYPQGTVAEGSPPSRVSTHIFAGVDVPLDKDLGPALLREEGLDAIGMPIGLRARRDLLLRAALRLRVETPTRRGGRLEIPLVLENVGAGHRVPAGFSQEREIWVHLRVEDANGKVLYEVGRVDRADEDLHDKTFVRVETNADRSDSFGRPEAIFGADVADGPDVPRWSPDPADGGTLFRGKGLVTLQNGFYRCVRCIGTVDDRGVCQPGPGQGRLRADRFADGDYDLDTGECRSNLTGRAALFETYFPIGALDASRGITRAPDAILDTRSLPPHAPARYVYELEARSQGTLRIRARLLFRAFPPFLLKAFAGYEESQVRRGKRPSGALIDRDALQRLEVVELASTEIVSR